jgi:hypothetical protein
VSNYAFSSWIDNEMVERAPTLELGQPLAAYPLNQYLPHKWFNPSGIPSFFLV